MDNQAYDFMRKILLSGGTPVVHAYPLVVLSRLFHAGSIKERGQRLVFTKAGRDRFMAEYRGEDMVVCIHKLSIAEGILDNKGTVFSLSSEAALEHFEKLQIDGALTISKESVKYDYLVFDFTDPVTKKEYLLFPGDLVVYTEQTGYVVHNFDEDV